MKPSPTNSATSAQPWAVAIDLADAASLGNLRLCSGIEACQCENVLWLRGKELEDELAAALRRLPGARRYIALSDGQLQPEGCRLPLGLLPTGPWTSLREWLQPALPAAAAGSEVLAEVPLRMERIEAFPEIVPAAACEPSVLLMSSSIWCAYAQDAPQVRLDRWTFAVSAAGDVLVRGKPLPPIPGTQYVEWDNVAVPLGWWWTPPVEAALVRKVLKLPDNHLALFAVDGSWQVVPLGEFVRATRAAVRASS